MVSTLLLILIVGIFIPNFSVLVPVYAKEALHQGEKTFNASDELRGRVMSVYTLVFAGSTPFGSMFAGGVTELFGPKGGFTVCGLSAILLLAIAMFLTRKSHGAS